MFKSCAPRSRRPGVAWSLSSWLLVSLLCLGPIPAFATTAVDIVRVEEDWEVVVGTPDLESVSPQITCAMSPTQGDDGNYASFELNHQSQPGYAAGGLHLHAWDGDYLIGSQHEHSSACLAESGETIQWTQAMSVGDGLLTYEVLNGQSETWGSFGGASLRVQQSTSLADLNDYSVTASLVNSGVGYGANRVVALKLLRVRLILANGVVQELNVHQDVRSATN